MKKLVVIVSMFFGLTVWGQDVREPEFAGEVIGLRADGSTIKLEKEYGDITSGISWSENTWDARRLEIKGGRSAIRFKAGDAVRLIVRASDNNSDPMAVISIYRLRPKKSSRTVLLGKDNSGTFLKSRTNAKALVKFDGRKFGAASYLIEISNPEAGEYGIVVSNPNSKDEKRLVVSCFGVD